MAECTLPDHTKNGLRALRRGATLVAMAHRLWIVLAAASVGTASILACVGDEPNLDPAPGDRPDGASPDGDAFDGSTTDAGETGPSCDHDLCTDFDRPDWVTSWTIVQRPTDGGESVVALSELNQPLSKPSSLRTLVRKEGDHAYISKAMPWRLGNGSRRVHVDFRLYVEQHDARGVVSSFNLKSERQAIMVAVESGQSLAIYEADNLDGGTVLASCAGLGSLPLRQWTRVAMTLEGRTRTAAGWLTLAVGDEAPRRCDLKSVSLSDGIDVYLGLLSLSSGTRIAQYDDVFIDIDP